MKTGEQNVMLPEIPSGEVFLERERIHRLIARALKGGVLILSSGEGSGKTYAVNSFLRNRLAGRQRPVMALWHQVVGSGEQTRRFWENYTLAVERSKPSAGKALRELGFPGTARQFEQWCEIARREFSPTEKFVIVIDDFHRITLPVAQEFVETALTNPIPSHLLIVLCRCEPKLNILSLLSKGDLARIGLEELLFTEEETAAYFRRRGMELSDEEVRSVHRDTEGLPLFMGIAAALIRQDGGTYRSCFLEKNIFRLYADGLLFSAAPEFRHYLIKLSLCEKWPLDLLHQSARLLPAGYRELAALEAELDKMGVVVYYDYYMPGYNLHHLFRDYLREKLRGLPFDEIREINVIAAQWCCENNLIIEASQHFELITDYAGFSGLVDSFQHRIPAATAGPLLEIAERLTANGQDGPDFDYLYCVTRGRLLWYLSRFTEAAALFQENIARFSELPLTPVNTRILAESWSYLGNLSFIKQYGGETFNAAACFENAERYYRLNPYPLPGPVTINYTGSYINQLAFPARAGELERRLNAFIDSLPPTANALSGHLHGINDLGRAELAFFQENLDAAEQYARTAVLKGRENRQQEIVMRGLFFLLRITLCRPDAGDMVNEFIELWKQKDALVENGECPFRNAQSDVFDGWLYIQTGKPMNTPGWLRGGNETSDLYSIFFNYECLVKAKYCYAQKEYREALAILDLPENRETLGSYLLGMIEMDCLKAVSCHRMGNEAEALAVMEQAYHAAAPNSVTMPFIELGNDMRLLASVALNGSTGIPRRWLEHIRGLASVYGKNLAGIAGHFRERTRSTAAVYLTRQEIAVLKGLSLGRNREEIAAETGQPLGAIKNLISVICTKLGAVNRADAVRIASGQGLLGNSLPIGN